MKLSFYVYLLIEHATIPFLEKLTWFFTNYEQEWDHIMPSLHLSKYLVFTLANFFIPKLLFY